MGGGGVTVESGGRVRLMTGSDEQSDPVAQSGHSHYSLGAQGWKGLGGVSAPQKVP